MGGRLDPLSPPLVSEGLTALKPSLDHDRKRLIRLYGDQALMYSNSKLVHSLRYAAFFSEKESTVMWQVLWLSPSSEQARPGPAEPVRPLRPWSDQKSYHLWSKPCIFRVLVGPIIVKLMLSSDGRTNLSLLPPPLKAIC